MAGQVRKQPQLNIPKAPAKRPRVERRLKDPKFVSWLHELECAATGTRHELQASHVIMGRQSTLKEDDSLAVPLCRRLHQGDITGSKDALHTLSEPVFWGRYGIDVLGLARDLYSHFKTGKADVNIGRQIIRAHRAMGELRLRAGIVLYGGEAQF